MVSECLDVVEMMQCLKIDQPKNVSELSRPVNRIKKCDDGISQC